MPISLAPNPSQNGFRPVATKIWSASNTLLSPPFTGSTFTEPLVPLLVPPVTLCPVRISSP